MASIRAECLPPESAGPTGASVCSRWSTIFVSSGEERWRRRLVSTTIRERNLLPPRLQRRMARERRLRRRRLLSEAGGAEVLARGVPPERVGGEEGPGVPAARVRGNASVASPLSVVSAATTQAGLICGLGPRRRLCLCQEARRLAQGQRHDRCQSART